MLPVRRRRFTVRRPFVRCAAPEFVRYAKVYSGRIVGTPPVLSLCPPCYWGFPPGFWCDLVSPKIRRNGAIIKPRQGLIRRYLQGRKCSYRTLFPCPEGHPVDPPEQALVEVGAAPLAAPSAAGCWSARRKPIRKAGTPCCGRVEGDPGHRLSVNAIRRIIRSRATMHGASWQHGAPSLASATVADKAGVDHTTIFPTEGG